MLLVRRRPEQVGHARSGCVIAQTACERPHANAAETPSVDQRRARQRQCCLSLIAREEGEPARHAVAAIQTSLVAGLRLAARSSPKRAATVRSTPRIGASARVAVRRRRSSTGPRSGAPLSSGRAGDSRSGTRPCARVTFWRSESFSGRPSDRPSSQGRSSTAYVPSAHRQRLGRLEPAFIRHSSLRSGALPRRILIRT